MDSIHCLKVDMLNWLQRFWKTVTCRKESEAVHAPRDHFQDQKSCSIRTIRSRHTANPEPANFFRRKTKNNTVPVLIVNSYQWHLMVSTGLQIKNHNQAFDEQFRPQQGYHDTNYEQGYQITGLPWWTVQINSARRSHVTESWCPWWLTFQDAMAEWLQGSRTFAYLGWGQDPK